MRFMNTWEIDERAAFYRTHPLLGPATQTLQNIRDAADANSDGWAYWPKPTRAAAKLMDVIEGERSAVTHYDRERKDVTREAVLAAYRPLKSFRTRSGIAFEIVETFQGVLF